MFHARMLAWPILACLLAFHAAAARPFSPLAANPSSPPAASSSSLPAASATSATLEGVYPGMSTGALSFASLADLPAGLLLEAGAIRIGPKDLDAELAKAPESSKAIMEKNQLFVLEQMATQGILLDLARKTLSAQDAPTTAPAEKMIELYLGAITQTAAVSDKEVDDWCANNKEIFGAVAPGKAKPSIKILMLQNKQREMADEHIRTLGKRIPIRLSASWAKEHAALALENPVDNARKSGLPAMVDFGAKGCRPCAMMEPILDALKKKYAGKTHIIYINVRENPFLASRYGIESIPVQVFFDKDGKEVFRHTGFYPQADIEKKLAGMGAKE